MKNPSICDGFFFIFVNMPIIDKIIAVKSIPALDVYRENMNDETKKLIRETYMDLGFTFNNENCNNCYEKAYRHIKKLTIENLSIMKNENCLFRLIDGKKLMSHGIAAVYTNANLTNEAALTFLKKTPGVIKFFQDYPENWREMAENFQIGKPFNATGKKAKTKSNGKPENETPGQGDESTGDGASQTVDSNTMELLKGKTKNELITIAENLELPSNEYEGKTKNELVEYLLTKMN